MKHKKLFYRSVGHRQDLASVNSWLACKDHAYKWDMDTRDSEAVQPKRRHKRSIKARDYGRLFNCTKFYYDPFLSEEESIDYFEERERLREIEGYKE